MKSTVNPPPHVYGTRALDRAADRRRDETWLGDRRADPATRLVLMDGLLVPVGGPHGRPRPLPPTVAGGGRPPRGPPALPRAHGRRGGPPGRCRRDLSRPTRRHRLVRGVRPWGGAARR